MQLSDIKGLGAKRIEKLAECGIRDPLDLLLLFPVKYYDRRAIVDWDGLAEGEEVIFKGRLIGRPFSDGCAKECPSRKRASTRTADR